MTATSDQPDEQGLDLSCHMKILGSDTYQQRWLGRDLYVLLEVRPTAEGGHIQITAGGGFGLDDAAQTHVISLLEAAVELLTDPDTTSTVIARGGPDDEDTMHDPDRG